MSRVVVIGSLNIDRIAEVDRIPRPGETVSAFASHTVHGGKGANQAYYAARTALPGVDVALLGCVGPDSDGSAMVGALADAGVDVEGVHVVDAPTGQAFILVDAGGENQIAVVAGANHHWEGRERDILFEADDLVVLQGEIPQGIIAASVASAHASRSRVVLNAAPFAAGLIELLAAGDLLVLNETEAGEAFGCSPTALPAHLGRVKPAFDVVVTLGAQGALVSPAPHERFQHVPAFPTDVVDTVGAGDAFVGGLASELAANASLISAVTFGVAAASIAVRNVGAWAPEINRARTHAIREERAEC